MVKEEQDSIMLSHHFAGESDEEGMITLPH
jgi:hypothetical protein